MAICPVDSVPFDQLGTDLIVRYMIRHQIKHMIMKVWQTVTGHCFYKVQYSFYPFTGQLKYFQYISTDRTSNKELLCLGNS